VNCISQISYAKRGGNTCGIQGARAALTGRVVSFSQTIPFAGEDPCLGQGEELALFRLPRPSSGPSRDVRSISDEPSVSLEEPIDLAQLSQAVGIVMNELSRWGQFVTRSHPDLVAAICRSGASREYAEGVLDTLSRDPNGDVVRYRTRDGRPRYRRRWAWEVGKPMDTH
jgi:hypothetical protein